MRTIISSLFIVGSCFVYGQNINFQDMSFKDLLSKAKKENKILFVDAYASWCGPCKLMERNVFTTASVSDFYNSNFINARIDMEKGEGRDIAAKYGVRSYPTYLFLNGAGDLVYQDVGYMQEDQFVDLGKKANSPNNKKGSFKERFEKGEKDPDFLINIMKANVQTDFDFAKKASERYFSNKKKTEEFSKDDVGLLLYFLKSSNDANYKVFQDRKTDILTFLPEQTYNEFNAQIKLGEIIDKTINSGTKTIDSDYFLKSAIPLVGEAAANKRLIQLKLAFYEQNANYPEYEKAALEYYKNADAFDVNELLKAAWMFAEHIKTPASLKVATQWAEKVVMKGENAENTYILAKLYYLTGKKDLAKNFAEQSKSIAQKMQSNSKLADELLNLLK